MHGNVLYSFESDLMHFLCILELNHLVYSAESVKM